MKVTDPEIVGLIDLNMRMLWTAEIQARQVGVKGAIHPFDRMSLPLLSTMLFDQCVEEGHKVFKHVKWPKEFAEDPATLLGILPSRAAAPQPSSSWPELLQPPAKSWVHLEAQLSLLLEQLVLCAAAGGRAGRLAAPEAVAETGAEEDGAEDAGAAGDASQPQPSAARQAKRQKQRERRKMGKAAARALAAGEAMPPECIKGGVVPPEALAARAGRSLAQQPVDVPLPSTVPAHEVLEAHALSALQEEMELVDPSTRFARSITAPAKVGPEALVAVSPQLSSSPPPGTPPVQATDDPAKVETADSDSARLDLRARDPSVSELAGRGVGRGRPMGPGLQDVWGGVGGGRALDAGRGMGRGRTMVPPPSLQGPGALAGTPQRAPGGLSQAWAPIPENDVEDDDDETGGQSIWRDGMNLAPDQSVLWAALDSSIGAAWHETSTNRRWSEHSAPSVSSYIQTPKATWCATPSPPMTPVENACLPPAFTGSDAGVFLPPTDFSSMGTGMLGSTAGSAVAAAAYAVPNYVTVPMALAHNCPHCGGVFAVPPGGPSPTAAESADSRRAAELAELRDQLRERDARIEELERKLRDQSALSQS